MDIKVKFIDIENKTWDYNKTLDAYMIMQKLDIITKDVVEKGSVQLFIDESAMFEHKVSLWEALPYSAGKAYTSFSLFYHDDKGYGGIFYVTNRKYVYGENRSFKLVVFKPD